MIYGPPQLAASFRTVRKNTVQIAEEIPEEQYTFQATADTKSVAAMLAHIAVAPRIWREIVESGVTTLDGFDFMGLMGRVQAEEAKPRTKSELIALLKEEGESFAQFLAGQTEENLQVLVKQPGSDATKSRLEILLSPKEHEMHHRAQLMLVQRLIGQVPHMTRAMNEQIEKMKAAAQKQ